MTVKKTLKKRSQKLSVCLTEKTGNEYEKDFYQWIKKQASFLKKKDFSHLDIENLIEEIESLGRSDKRALRSYLIVLILHLLKKKYQNEMQKNTNSWESSIRNARREIQLILEDSPSLKRELNKMLPYAYEKACEDAVMETKLSETIFPKECPWTIEQLLKNQKD